MGAFSFVFVVVLSFYMNSKCIAREEDVENVERRAFLVDIFGSKNEKKPGFETFWRENVTFLVLTAGGTI
jgi:hypothetical protein